jgi:hypothetical protein
VVQFPAVGHDTEASCELVAMDSTLSGNSAGRASAHTPFVDVMVKASLELLTVMKDPTAVQFPEAAHDTDLKSSSGYSDWTPPGNTAGRASAHTPLVDVTVNASSQSDMLLNHPTAVQFPADAHDTELS